MTKYCLEKKVKGNFYYFVPKSVSEAKSKELKKEGQEIFNSRQEAIEEVKRKK